MGKSLTAAQRKSMPKREFGEPKSKGFPMEDKKHDRLAIGGATRSYNAGNISKGTEDRIKSEARSKLGDAMKSAKNASHGMKMLKPSGKKPLDVDNHHSVQKVTGKTNKGGSWPKGKC